ncbi:ThuA domain-containing protein [Mycetocola sp. 2940]|uniref:ThuA domain-containing protein n=1 Tax=Mycetocola sp. 2940 TaxID=3156452 RepID=UPI0033988819
MTHSRSALIVRAGWEGHSPVAATDLFVPHLVASGFEVRVEESTSVYADAAGLASVDLIMQCVTMSTIEPDELSGLTAAVRAGTGLAGWHGGIADSFRASSDYFHLVGGQFASHPGKPASEERDGSERDNFVPYTVAMTELGRQHPITEGIADFDLETEQYWVLSDDLNDVLATTTQRVRAGDPWHREVTSPAVWTRQWGDGRIFVATPGHSMDVLQHANVRTIIERGLLWASR